MNPVGNITASVLVLFTAGSLVSAQSASIRLVASQSTINSGQQVTVEAYIDDLPEAMHGYQIGVDISGGTAGQLTAAQFEGSVTVNPSRSDWVYRELADAGEKVITAGDHRDPPRLFAIFFTPGLGAQPSDERYLGTFVLQASADAAGDFVVNLVPAGVASPAEQILMPVDAADPPIPANASGVTISVQLVTVTCTDNDGDGYGSPGNANCPNGAFPDCDDADDQTYPGAAELCDGRDNNCDAQTDEGGVCAPGNATLRLVASPPTINSGQQVTVDAYIANLPVPMQGYQVGLDITGGTSGSLAAASFAGSVNVNQSRSDWVFRELVDAGEQVVSAGNNGDPPRLVAQVLTPVLGALPTGERYLGTYVLQASTGASGVFSVGFVPADPPSEGQLILIPVDDDGTLIPATSTGVSVAVNFVEVTCEDGDGDGYASPGDASCPNGPVEDCDDADASVFPGAVEVCDFKDNNCDGQTDEGGVCGTQTATLHLVASETTLDPGQQVTVEAFVDNLPIPLHGYQIGLDITGGVSGQITAAPFEDSVTVLRTRADWAFREVADGGAPILSAGDNRFPPRLFGLISPPDVGAFPTDRRYLGTFVLAASLDAAGNFNVGITPPDMADSAAATILITLGGSTFPADVDDPAVIPVTSAGVTMRVFGPAPTCMDADGDGYGLPGDASCPNGPAEDCHDADPTVFPGATEVCDGLDNDCSGEADDSPDCVIPAVSDWGLAVMLLLVFTAGTAVVRSRAMRAT